ncbi:MAG: lipopolysaccharide biosynthesis protein [Mesorhizobium sp.]
MESELFDPPRGSLRKSVGRGAVVTALAQGARVVLQIVSVVVLARLLSPRDFGVVAMCAPVLAFVGLFQDLGLSQATIQKSDIRHEEVNVLFWINVGVSIVLACMLASIGPLVASFYGEPGVAALVVAFGLQIMVCGLGAQHLALLTRRMQFTRLAVIDVGSGVVSLVVSIAWTFIDNSYWALFAGTLAGTVFATVGYWISSRWRPGKPAKVDGISGLINFGAGITGFNFANFFARNLDNILIGKYWGEMQLGLYDRAYKLLLFPLGQITNPLSKVMIPALSRLQDEPDRYRSAYLRVLPLILLLALPGVAFATAMSGVLVPFVLGEQWQHSADIFFALGFAGLLQPLNNPAGWLFISQGRSSDFMRWGIITAATSVLAFVIGLPYGAVGVAVAYAISEYLRTPFLWLYIGKMGPLRAGHIFRVAMPFVLGAHLALVIVWYARPMLAEQPLAALAGGAVLSYVVVVVVASAFAAGRETLGEAFGLAKRAFPRHAVT